MYPVPRMKSSAVRIVAIIGLIGIVLGAILPAIASF